MTVFLEPQDLRTVDPRPHEQSFDEWAAQYMAQRLEERFGPDSEIAQILGLATPDTSREVHNHTNRHRLVLTTFICTVCGRVRKGATQGVCQYCRSVDTRGQEHRQGV